MAYAVYGVESGPGQNDSVEVSVFIAPSVTPVGPDAIWPLGLALEHVTFKRIVLMSADKPPSPFQVRSSRVVWSSPWYSVRQDHIILPDGQPGVYNVVQHPGAVWVIPVTGDGHIVLLYHYRCTVL